MLWFLFPQVATLGSATKAVVSPSCLCKSNILKKNKIIQTYEFLYTGSSAIFCTEKLVRSQHQEKENGHSVKNNGTEETSGLLQNKQTGCMWFQNFQRYTLIPVTKESIPLQDLIRHWSYLNEVTLNSIDADVGLIIRGNAPKALEPWRVIRSQGTLCCKNCPWLDGKWITRQQQLS